MSRLKTLILRVFLMSIAMFFTLFTITAALLMVPVMLVMHSVRKVPTDFTLKKASSANIIEGQYKEVD